MMTLKNVCFVALVLLVGASSLPGSTHWPVSRTCPLCETEFEFWAVASGTQHGKTLDGCPYGFIDAPWPIPVCPSCGMVLIRKHWTTEELESLRNFVATEGYRSAVDSMETYYLAAILLEHLDAPCVSIADAYLKASWQEQGPRGRRT